MSDSLFPRPVVRYEADLISAEQTCLQAGRHWNSWCVNLFSVWHLSADTDADGRHKFQFCATTHTNQSAQFNIFNIVNKGYVVFKIKQNSKISSLENGQCAQQFLLFYWDCCKSQTATVWNYILWNTCWNKSSCFLLHVWILNFHT